MRSFFRSLVRVVMAPAVMLGLLFTGADGQLIDNTKAAQSYRSARQPVTPLSDTTIIAEAEEFHIETPGWQAKPWGTNYYAATFANTFLSRKAYLGAPEQCEETVAHLTVQVPKSGQYLALIRYEAVYRFETRFRLRVEQGGKTKLDRLYGARDNLKIWAFNEKLKNEVAWSWGAVENVVWEGHDAVVDLEAGPARLTLVAGKQPPPGARRNIDLVMLTSDREQIDMRIAKERYLPLDGMLTQAGDVYLKVHNHKAGSTLTLTLPPGTEHSPYWVHLRTWKPITITSEPGQSTDWIEVGGLLDSLNDGQWNITAKAQTPRFDLEFGVRDAAGNIMSIQRFQNLTGTVELAYDADTRYSRRIRRTEDVLYDLVDYLKKQPIRGTAPKRTLIYGYTFARKPDNAKYNAALDEFIRLIGATAVGGGRAEDSLGPDGLIRGYIDVRHVPTPKLEDYCKNLQAEGRADKIAVVSLGDEIGLPRPPAKDQAGFHAWLQSRKLRPSDVDPDAGNDWNKVVLDLAPATAQSKPSLYYYSKIYSYRYGIHSLKQRTDILRKYLPNAGIGANFSPHHEHLYLGDTYHWISVFREEGMTQPWGEDYIWQVPVGTQQMNFIMLDMYRAGIRGKPNAKIHYYVMPHWPGNTPNSWRRQFYGDIGHGAKIFNLFEFRPVQVAYTENHVSLPEMFQETRRGFHELGQFEDIVQDGQVRPAQTALWFSETADAWDDNRHPFDAAKRCLYIAIRHQQVPLDFVVEGDDLKSYQVLYLTDQHVSRAASRNIADWVKGGGTLFATAGAGMYDEFHQPNTMLRELLGVDPKALDIPEGSIVKREKEDLPFVEPLDTVTLAANAAEVKMPVISARSRFAVKGAQVMGSFSDGSPVVSLRQHGKGRAYYVGFLPGLTYFKPALPLRPVDRGSTDDALAHFIPTNFDRAAAALIGMATQDLDRPVICSEPLVETSVLESKHGVLIPLVNWSAGPIKDLSVTINLAVPMKNVTSASGKPVKVVTENGKQVITLDLDVADALIGR
ncbi:MAG: beta-galactosidase trimerization domain-containing protein [Gemmataceae bacterium]